MTILFLRNQGRPVITIMFLRNSWGYIKLTCNSLSQSVSEQREKMISIFFQITVSFHWKFVDFFLDAIFQFFVLVHSSKAAFEGSFKIETCHVSIFSTIDELVKLEHKDCF